MKRGVNFFGSFETEDGIGRAAALNVECLKSTGMPVRDFVLSRPVALQTGNDTIIDDNLLRSLDHRINIFQFSARWVPHYFSRLAAGAMDGFYNIGYWFCEVPKIPEQWARQFQFFDEIWTASSFCQSAFARSANIPVVRIPLYIESQEVSARIVARSSGVDCGPFRFLTIFNTYSDAERKNALFSLRAFVEAHGNNPSVRLTIKVSNLEHDILLSQKLSDISKTYSNIDIIAGYVPSTAIHRLYDEADAYVSLHRAEGFGLTISDAMSRGIPVIATGYSGNMEFCDASDTTLVGYELREVGHNRLRYRNDDVWAEPNMKQAIAAFRDMTLHYPAMLEKAIKARSRIRRHFSINEVGGLMSERLDLIGSDFSYSNDLDGRHIDREVDIFDTYGF